MKHFPAAGFFGNKKIASDDDDNGNSANNNKYNTTSPKTITAIASVEVRHNVIIAVSWITRPILVRFRGEVNPTLQVVTDRNEPRKVTLLGGYVVNLCEKYAW